MTKFKALIVGLVASVTLVLGGSVAVATSTSAPETTASNTVEPRSYGLCVNVKTQAVRALQVDNLSKSVFGACAQDGSEKFLGVLGTGYIPPATPLPTQVAFSVGSKNYLCSAADSVKLREKLRYGRYSKVVEPARYVCVDAVRAPGIPRGRGTR